MAPTARVAADAADCDLEAATHVSTEPNDGRVVDGIGHSGDPDLILHMAVCRQSAITVFGPDPTVVFTEIDPTLVISQLVEELTWALAHGSEAYAVLNACRARFSAIRHLERRRHTQERCGSRPLFEELGANQECWSCASTWSEATL